MPGPGRRAAVRLQKLAESASPQHHVNRDEQCRVLARSMAITLSPYKLKALKHMSFLAGCAATSSKPELQHRLLDYLAQRHLSPKPVRIVSIDMGIRNLAYCVLETSLDTQPSPDCGSTKLKVNIWRKLDLTKQLGHVGEADSTIEDPVDASAERGRMFSPANVSKLAYNFSKQIMDHKPDVILIEEQRFRSSGGSAIQEWTIRVNMLESMLWACLEALKHEQAKSTAPSVHSVSPAKVAKFWIAGNVMSLTPTTREGLEIAEEEPPGRVKVTKKDKISVLQSWLKDSNHRDVSMTFSEEAQSVAAHFSAKASRRVGTSAAMKLDDLTDCLLQGAAWTKWQINSSKLVDLLQVSSSSTSTK